MSTSFMVTAFGLALLASPLAAAPSELNGTWVEQAYRPTRDEHPGKIAPPRDPMTLVIDGHLFVEKRRDRAVRQSLLKYVSGQTPNAIDLTTVVADEFWQTRAIYKVEGDTLTICESVRDKPRPTEFRRWKGERELTQLTTFKRQPPKVEDGQTAP